MKVSEAISQADYLYKNTFTQQDKKRWLSRADELVKKTIVDAHEGGDDIEAFPQDGVENTELIMESPYDEGYVHYLMAQMHYANDEIDRYNRSITMFNALLSDFAGYWKKNHAPKGCGRFRF